MENRHYPLNIIPYHISPCLQLRKILENYTMATQRWETTPRNKKESKDMAQAKQRPLLSEIIIVLEVEVVIAA